MTLNTLWFILIGVLFTGFFFLEGFDYGVGILRPFLGKNDEDRRVLLNTIGPVWDANEVWLVAAGEGLVSDRIPQHGHAFGARDDAVAVPPDRRSRSVSAPGPADDAVRFVA